MHQEIEFLSLLKQNKKCIFDRDQKLIQAQKQVQLLEQNQQNNTIANFGTSIFFFLFLFLFLFIYDQPVINNQNTANKIIALFPKKVQFLTQSSKLWKKKFQMLFWITLEYIPSINTHLHQKFGKLGMIDWNGLLKFSLKYADGTKKSDFQEMSEEDKKFLEGVMSQYCNSEIEKIADLLEKLSEQEKGNEEERLNQLEYLQELLDSLDQGNTLYKMNGHITLLKIVFYSKYNSNRIVALQILASANQNDASVQNDSINSGAMELVQLISKETDLKIKQNMMSTISSMIRGENLEAKRIFIKIGGLELLKTLSQNATVRLTNKINNLLKDLLYYDSSLDKKYNDLSHFSNTAGLKIAKDKHDLTYDVNAEMQKQNYLPENAKFKGLVSIFLNSNQEMKKGYEKWVEENS